MSWDHPHRWPGAGRWKQVTLACICALAMVGTAITLVAQPQQASADPAAVPGPVTQTAIGGLGTLSGTIGSGVCEVEARVLGGGGGNEIPADNFGGRAADIAATFTVAPGQTYEGGVGGGGGNDGLPGGVGGGAGGAGSGGNPGTGSGHIGAGGGGMSQLDIGGLTMIVAGGGGGSGAGHSSTDGQGADAGAIGIAPGTVVPGGTGGDAYQQYPTGGIPPGPSGAGGEGGGAAGPGAGGLPFPPYTSVDGFPGSGNDGGDGGADTGFDTAGGGGGGWFGGGGGASSPTDGAGPAIPQGNVGGGGGGGSSYVAATSPDGLATVPTAVSGDYGLYNNTGSSDEPGFPGQIDLVFVPCDYNLSVEKTVDPASALVGDTVTWTITVTNDGPDHMTLDDTVTINDTLPGAGPKTLTSITHTPGTSQGLDQNAMTCSVAVGSPMPASLDCSQPYSASAAAESPSGGVRGLDPGGSIMITYTQVISAGDITEPPSDLVNDVSVTDRNGTSTDSAAVEPAREESHIDIEKVAAPAISNGDGTYDVTYELIVTAPASVPTCLNDGTDGCFLTSNNNVQVSDDLTGAFPASSIISSSSAVTSGPCVGSAVYDGVTNVDLLIGSDVMFPGDVCVITITATVTADASDAGAALLGTTTNTAEVISDEASDTDSSDVTLAENPAMDVIKTVSADPVNNGDGTFDLEYTIDVINTGDVELRNLQVLDGLDVVFGTALVAGSQVVTSGICSADATYTGVAPNTLLLTGTDTLPVGAACEIVITVTVTVDSDDPAAASVDTDYTNTASGSGNGPGGGPADDSDTGTTQFSEDPAIDVLKTQVAGSPINNGDGTFDVTYELVVTNVGNVELRDVQVTDGLDVVFGPALLSASQTVTAGICSENLAYTGVAPNDGLLIGTDTLAVAGDSCTIEVTATIAVDTDVTGAAAPSTDYTNTAGASGDSPSGEGVTDTDDEPAAFVENPSIDVDKNITAGPTNNGDGTYSLEYTIDVVNDGDVELRDVQVLDGLDVVFGNALISGSQSVTAPCTADAAYTGIAPNNLLLAGTDTLNVGDSCQIVISVVVTVDSTNPDSVDINTDYTNNATGSGTSPGGSTPSDTDPATTDFSEDPAIAIDKNVTAGPTNNEDGTYTIEYTLDVTNTGDVELRDVQATDGLDAIFGAALVSASASVTAPCTASGTYTGTAPNTDLLAGTNTLAIGDACQIVITVVVSADAGNADPVALDTDYTNTAGTSGTSPTGETVTDDDPATTSVSENPSIDVLKNVASGPTNNGDGTYTLVYEIDVINDGDVELRNVQVLDGLDVVFGNALVSGSQLVTAPCTADATYTGVTPNTNLLAGTDTLAVGDTCTIEITVVVTVDSTNPDAVDINTDYTNNATGSGTSPSGGGADDTDPATTNFAESPSIDVDKNITAGPTNNGDGTYTLEYTIDVANTGDVELRNVQVLDGLDIVFGNALISGSQLVTAPCTADAAYTGVTPNTNLLTGTDTLAIGDTCQIVITVVVTVDADNPDSVDIDTDYTNNATGDGTSPSGTDVDDTDPATTNFTEEPSINLTKDIVAGPTNNEDGTYSLVYELTLTNDGDVEVRNAQMTDGLDAVFGAALVSASPTFTAGTCSASPTYTGSAPNTLLLAGTDTLDIGEFCTVQIAVVITTDAANADPVDFDTDYTNIAVGSGTSPSGEPLSDDDDATAVVSEDPSIDVIKNIVAGPDNNGDGTYTLVYEIDVINDGDVELRDVQVADGLDAVFGNALVSGSQLATAPCTADLTYTGVAPNTDLLVGTDTLAVGDSCTITLTAVVTVDSTNPDAVDIDTDYTNSAAGDGTSPGGTDVDDDDPATTNFAESPSVDVDKNITAGPTNNEDGTYTLEYTIDVENTGDVELRNVQVLDGLDVVFGNALVSGTQLASAPCTADAAYTGVTPNTNLLTGTDTLAIGDTCQIVITVVVTVDADNPDSVDIDTNYTNNATGSGTSPSGTDVDDTDPATTSFEENPSIDVDKNITAGPTNNEDGTYTLEYTIDVVNDGDVELRDVQIVDGLDAVFGNALVSGSQLVTAPCSANAGYTGITPNTDLLTGADTLQPGDTCTITLTAVVTVDSTNPDSVDIDTDYTNSAAADGTSPAGENVDDDDPATTNFAEAPSIDVTKDIVAGPTNNEDGTYSLTYELTLTNTGDVEVRNAQLTDGLDAVFGAALLSASPTLTAGTCSANPTYTGTTPNTLLFAGTDTLGVGEFCTVQIAVVITTDAANADPVDFDADYTNIAVGSGTSPSGEPLSDADDATAVVSEDPSIDVIKNIVAGPDNNGDGTYTLVYEIEVINDGDVELRDVQVADGLDAVFGNALVSGSQLATAPCTADLTYTGVAPNTDLLVGTDTLAVGDTCTITLTAVVTVDSTNPDAVDIDTDYTNSAAGEGTSPGGTDVDDDDPATTNFAESPSIDVDKNITAGPTNNEDGTYTLEYTIDVENTGDVELRNVQVLDGLDVVFGNALVSGTQLASAPCTADAAYTGVAPNTNLLTGTDTLAIGDTCQIVITVVVTVDDTNPDSVDIDTNYTNNATGSGTSPSGTDVDDTDPATTSFEEAPSIDVTKDIVAGPTNNADGTYSLTYELTLANTGDVEVRNAQLTDGLGAVFGPALVSASPTITAGTCSANPTYTGSIPNTLLFAGTDTLDVGESCTVQIAVVITTDAANADPVDFDTDYTNIAVGSGTSPSGEPLSDDDDATAVVSENPSIDVDKNITAGPTNNGDGTYSLEYTIDVENTGDVELRDVQVLDGLDTVFGNALVSGSQLVTAPCTADLTYTGVAPNTNLLVGTDTLQPGDTCQIVLSVVVTVDSTNPDSVDIDTDYTNSAAGDGTSPAGTGVDDDDPATTNFAEEPGIDVTKNIVDGPTNNADGTYSLTYELILTNTGDVELRNAQLTDGLDAVFGPALVSAASTVTSGICSVNPTYTGAAPNTDLFVGTDTLAIGASCTVSIAVVITTDAANADPVGFDTDYTNIAEGTGTSPSGEPFDDTDDATAVVSENPSIDVIKNIASGPDNNGDGTYTLVYEIQVINDGDVELRDVQVQDGLDAVFGNALVSGSQLATAPCTATAGYTGVAPNTDLLVGTDVLQPGDTCLITLTAIVTVDSTNPDAVDINTDYTNSAAGDGTSPAGTDVDDDDPATTNFAESPSIDVDKNITAGPTNNGDGTYTLEYTIDVENTGDVELRDVQVVDGLDTVFGNALVSGSQLVTAPCTADLTYTGIAPNTNLLVGTDTLQPGDTCQIVLDVTVTVDDTNPDSVDIDTDYTNEAAADGTSPSGTDVDDTDPATTNFAENPSIDVTKNVVDGPTNNGDGTHSLTYELVVTNDGDVELRNVQLTDGLDAIYGAAMVSASPLVTAGTCSASTTYTGAAPDTDLFTGADTMAVGDSCTVQISVVVTSDSGNAAPLQLGDEYLNVAETNGTSPTGEGVDDSDDATAVFEENPSIDVIKNVVAGPDNNGDGTYTLVYEIDVINDGDVNLANVQVTDGLDAVFGNALVSGSQLVTAPCTADLTYTGVAPATNLLTGTDTLLVGEECTITLTAVVTVDADNPDAVDLDTDYTNSAGASGTSPSGDGVNDDDPATTNFAEAPSIDVDKNITAGPTNNEDGTYTLEYTIDVTNTGDVELRNVQVLDGLDVVFGAALVSGTQLVDAPCSANTGYTGIAPNTDLLGGGDTLQPGDTCQIVITVVVTVDADNPDSVDVDTNYTNEATGEGTSPAGTGVDDTDPATTNFVENPSIDVDKNITAGPTNNGDGTYTLEYTIDVENTGDVELRDVQVVDGLDTVFGNALVSGSQLVTAPCTADLGYTGIAPNTNLLVGTDTLQPGDTCQIVLDVTVTVDDTNPDSVDIDTDYTNEAAADGTSPSGTDVDDTDPATTNFAESPSIDVEKSIVDGPTSNGDGTHSLTYEITLTNDGDVELRNVQLTDGLEAVYGSALISAAPVMTAGTCSVNPAYTGTTPTTLLFTGTDTLGVGDACTVQINVVVTTDSDNAAPVQLGDGYTNIADGSGSSPTGDTVSDDDDATTLFEENPSIAVDKAIIAGPTNNTDGTYDLTYQISVTNDGDVELRGVQVTDGLEAVFGPALLSAAQIVSAGTCSASPTYAGAAPDTDLLDGTDVLDIGESCTIDITVTVSAESSSADPVEFGPAYNNIAAGDGTSPAGESVSDDDDATTVFTENPSIDVDKNITAGPTNNGDGTYTLEYTIDVLNDGNVELRNVQVLDGLDVVFGNALVSGSQLVDAPCTADGSYTGIAPNTNLLTGTDTLAVGDGCQIVITVDVTVDADDPDAVSIGTDYTNNATSTGTSPSGTDVDDTDPATTNFEENPSIEVTKAVVGEPVNNGDGTHTITYLITAENNGDVELRNVQLTDGLDAVFGPDLVSATTTAALPCTTNAGYTGTTAGDINLLSGADTLAIGEICSATVEVIVSGGNLGPHNNVADGSGISPTGESVADDDPAIVTLVENPAIDVVKTVAVEPISNLDGSYTMTWQALVTNTGDVPLNDVQVTDDLSVTYFDAVSWGPASSSVHALDACTAEPTFDGDPAGVINLLTGTDSLAVDQSCRILIEVTFVPGAELGAYTNSVDAEGTSPGGEGVDDSADADATVVENPAIGLAKVVVDGPTNNGTGSFDIVYELVTTNTGDVPLKGVQVTDDLAATFAAAQSFTATNAAVTAGTCTDNAAFDGDADQNLLSGTDTLAVGASCTIQVEVTFDPGATLGDYVNAATTSGTSPAGENVDDGASTAESVEENPAIDVTKTIVDPGIVNNGDGSYDVTFGATVTNTGDVPLNNVQIDDDLTATFATAQSWDVDPNAVAVTAGTCTANSNFDGDAVPGLLAGADTLTVGASCSVTFTATVVVGEDIDFTNDVFASGTSPGGTDVDANDDVDLELPENPEITLVKEVVDPPAVTSNEDGSYNLTYQLVVTNTGDVRLDDIQIVDNMGDTYADAVAWEVVDTDIALGQPCSASATYNGGVNDRLLTGTDTLLVGESCTVEIEVLVTPGADLGPYDNTAATIGTSPGGSNVTDTDEAPAWFTEEPQISINKQIVGEPVNNGDGTYSVTYGMTVENSGNIILYNVQVDDDLSTTFAAAGGFTATDVRVEDGACTANDDYDGDSTSNAGDIGTLSGDDAMAVGDTCDIEIDVTFTPGSFLGSYDNSAVASGSSPAGDDVNDISQDGAESDPEGDGPGDNSDPTPLIVTESPAIDVTKDTVGEPVNNGDGTYGVTYAMVVTNTGDIVLNNVQVDDDLATTFASTAGFTANDVRVTSGTCTPSTTFDGAGDTGTLDGDDSLAIGESCEIAVDVTVTAAGSFGPHTNTAAASGTSPAGTGVAGDDPADVEFDENPAIAVTKDVTAGPTNNEDGSYGLQYSMVVTNIGDIVLTNVQVDDDLAATFASATSWVADSTTVIDGPCTSATSYDGATNIGTLSGTDSLAVGESCTITVDLTVVPGADLGPYENTAVANGTSPGGEDVTDVSQDGIDGAPEGDDPTPAWFTEDPQISVTKDIVEGPTSNSDGTYDITYQMVVANSGNVPINNVQVEDNLAATYAGAVSFTANTVSIAAGSCAASLTYDGVVDLGTLTGTDTLGVGDTCTINLEVTVTPGGDLGPYNNNAEASGFSAAGLGLADISQDGNDADPDGDNDPSNDGDPTPAEFPQNPAIEVTKAIVDVYPGDNSIPDITYKLVVTNTGDVALDDVQVTDNLAEAFGAADSWTFLDLEVVSGPCTESPNYDGDVNDGLLTGLDTLAIGDSCGIRLQVNVREFDGGSFTNTVDATGTSPSGAVVEDDDDEAITVPVADVPSQIEQRRGLPALSSPTTRTTTRTPSTTTTTRTTTQRPPERLAFTGSSTVRIASVAMSLIAIGGAIVITSRRREEDEDGFQ